MLSALARHGSPRCGALLAARSVARGKRSGAQCELDELLPFVQRSLRSWQRIVLDLTHKSVPANGTINWLFDDQTYSGGRGKGTLAKHCLAVTKLTKLLHLPEAADTPDDVRRIVSKYDQTTFSFAHNVSGLAYLGAGLSKASPDSLTAMVAHLDGLPPAHNVVICRLPRSAPHDRSIYTALDSIPDDVHVVIMGSFWPDIQMLPSKTWNLWEWSHGNLLIHIDSEPYKNDAGPGRVGLSNTNEDGMYKPLRRPYCPALERALMSTRKIFL